MRIGVVGTRFTPLHSPKWLLEIESFVKSLPQDAEVVVNGAPGTDEAVVEMGRARGLKVTVLFAGDDYGSDPRFFLHRNRTVIDHADELHAFWDGESHGTLHAITLARHQGLPVRVHMVHSEAWQRVS
ncbi:MAG: hypothetical protein FJ318_05380 [SAR202 cluster bacterium]|nr:hypothetical protein [SAR202 cluster bacterium]